MLCKLILGVVSTDGFVTKSSRSSIPSTSLVVCRLTLHEPSDKTCYCLLPDYHGISVPYTRARAPSPLKREPTIIRAVLTTLVQLQHSIVGLRAILCECTFNNDEHPRTVARTNVVDSIKLALETLLVLVSSIVGTSERYEKLQPIQMEQAISSPEDSGSIKSIPK